MSGPLNLNEPQRDRVLAVAAAVFAGSLIAGARALEDSLLSDAVGAGGVPQGVGIAVGLAAVALFAKSFVVGKARKSATATSTSSSTSAAATAVAPETETPEALPWTGGAARTVGLVAILLAYGALLPWLGYALTISLLVLACGTLAGAPLKAPLLLCALVAGPLLWALFDWALKVRMPVGTLWA